MKQDKLEFEVTLNMIRNTERLYKKEKRAEAIAAGGSCLTCKHTKVALGKKLLCKLKDKLVSQHNYCEFWNLKEKKS